MSFHTRLELLSRFRAYGVSLIAMALLCGCSVKRLAINTVGDALAGGGSTFASDNDPELVRAALPFSLKLIETMLEESPNHEGLLLAAVSGFTQFAYGFVQQEADRIEDADFAAAETVRRRARNLYLRGRDYGLRGLDHLYPGCDRAIRENPLKAVRVFRKQDVPLLYWTGAAWGAAIGISKDNPQMISEQIIVEALIDRALELNEEYNRGAIHAFLITYEMARQGAEGQPTERAFEHFQRACELSGGLLAGPYVAYAETVMVQQQDAKQFKSLLEKALSIDPDALPEARLENLIQQDRARWLLSRVDKLFLISDTQ